MIELGTHDELMAAGGRYRTMFELQASRFERKTARKEFAGCLAMRRPAAGAVLDVARAQTRLPSRAAAAAGVFRAVAAGGPAGCAAGAVDEVAGGRCAAPQSQSGDGAGGGLGGFGGGDVVPKVISDRTQRRFRDRVAVALESHVAGLQASVGHHRSSRTSGVSGPAGHAARSGVRAGPYVHVVVLHVRVDFAAGGYGGAA